MTITIHRDLEQGGDSWLAARCGVLTASEIKLILTPKTLKYASNDKSRSHVYELLAQRITKHVEPQYIGDDMLRGMEDEITAREIYSQRFSPVEEVGFITNDDYGFTIGYSPDGLVADDGLIEVKSRRQKYQVQTIVDWIESGAAPDDYLLQCQTGMLVSGRDWIDLISYSGGLPMIPMRLHADPVLHDAILNAAGEFERQVREKMAIYEGAITQLETHRMVPTERKIEQEMFA